MQGLAWREAVFFACALQFGYLEEDFCTCDADFPTSVILLLVTTWMSSGAVRPASGGEQVLSCQDCRLFTCCGQQEMVTDAIPIVLELWFLVTGSCCQPCKWCASFDSGVSQGRAELGQAVLLKSWACTHSDETLSWKDGGNWNTLLKGEDPKEYSWSNGKSLSGRKSCRWISGNLL